MSFASCGLEKYDCLPEITTKEGQQQQPYNTMQKKNGQKKKAMDTSMRNSIWDEQHSEKKRQVKGFSIYDSRAPLKDEHT